MAGNIFAKELSSTPVTLESSGASTATNLEVAASTNLDARNAGNGAQSFWYTFEFNGGFGSAPTVGAALELYAVPAVDGTNFAEVDTTAHLLQDNCLLGYFKILKAQTGAQRLVIQRIFLEPLLYKMYILNKTTQTMSSTWTLKVYPSLEQFS